MQSTRRSRLRTFVVLLGLAANLVASGAPVLHVLLHRLHEAEAHHRHGSEQAAHAPEPAPPGTGHPASDVHPQALHDDAQLSRRDAEPLPFPAVAAALPERVELPAESPATEPAGSLRSRAPPPGDPARAPPLL